MSELTEPEYGIRYVILELTCCPGIIILCALNSEDKVVLYSAFNSKKDLLNYFTGLPINGQKNERKSKIDCFSEEGDNIQASIRKFIKRVGRGLQMLS